VTRTGDTDLTAQSTSDAHAEAMAAATATAGVQGLLFDDDLRPMPVSPSVRPATGSGTQRLYGFRDVLLLKVIKRLLDAGISLQQIRTAIAHLSKRGFDDLTQITLMSDGASVYMCTSPDEVIDLLAGGQGVFGIALGGVWREVEGTLSELPTERADGHDDGESDGHANDELAARRRARMTG